MHTNIYRELYVISHCVSRFVRMHDMDSVYWAPHPIHFVAFNPSTENSTVDAFIRKFQRELLFFILLLFLARKTQFVKFLTKYTVHLFSWQMETCQVCTWHIISYTRWYVVSS